MEVNQFTVKKNKKTKILVICFIAICFCTNYFLNQLGERSGVKTKIKEIKEEYVGVITKKFSTRNTRPTHLEIRIMDNNYINVSPNRAIIKAARIGDSILKPKNENFIYLISSQGDTRKFFYTKLSYETRNNKHFPKQWKDKWMESSKKHE